MYLSYSTHFHMSPHSMEIIPSDEKNLPYISSKNVGSLLNLNGKVKVDGKIANCTQFSSLFTLNSMDCYRSNSKMKISELFSDEDSIRRAFSDKKTVFGNFGNFEEVHKNIIRNSCGRHIIVCDKFGNFLHKIASTTSSGEQRFFILQSCNHAMSFKIMHKIKEVGGISRNRWVVHFFDPNRTNVIARSEVLNPGEFLDLRKFSLRMFVGKCYYKDYFGNNESETIENECSIYEYSDIKDANLYFSTLETLSQDRISGCMIYHMMLSNISSFDIRGVLESRSFSTLSCDVRREIFFAKNSSGVSALHLAMEQDKPNSVILYDNFLQELSYDEQVNLLPDIINNKSPEGVPALFIAMQQDNSESIDNFGLLLDRLMNIRYRMSIEDFYGMLLDTLLAKRKDGLSALCIAVSKNNTRAVLSFGRLVDRIFILKDIMDSKKLSDMIFGLLNCKDTRGIPILFFALQKGCSDTVLAFGTLVDKLLLMKDYLPGAYMADIIFELLMSNGAGDTGLFSALQKGHTDAVLAFGGLISRFVLLKHSISEKIFNSMMLDILSAIRGDNIPGIFAPLSQNNMDVVGAYSSLLVYASKEVRKEIFCLKDGDGYPAVYAFMFHNNPQSLAAYNYFLQALSCDEQIDLLPELLISKNSNGDPALLVAMQEGYANCIDSYGVLIEKQLMTIRDKMSLDDFANLVLSIVSAKRSDGISALFMGVYNNRVSAIEAYSRLLDKVLSLLRGTISDDKLADIIYALISYFSPSYGESPVFTALRRGHAGSVVAFALLIDKLILMRGYVSHNKLVNMIFKLLKARTSTNIDGLFMALQEGNTDSVAAFGVLLDRFISMMGYVEDVLLADMVFDLLMCKSGDNNISGLFMAMQEGHHGTVDAFRKLLERTIIFKDYILGEFFDNMLLDTVISRRSDGISGLFAALKNNFPEAVKSYGRLLSLIPKDELVNVLVASNSFGVPAALFAAREALDSYFAVISDLPTSVIYALYSQLKSIRGSIGHTLLYNSDFDGRYKLLLEKIKELVDSSNQNY
ncbi:ShET2/EspL2 family type III secretion system effector toxin [Candidatus Ichthyocystis sparus]|uniref:ShET2/EspL2 family type III secretion system effector toxin n=1 Tax=Candidatus Ichthyocystis sparus TaxID=1561004 RepID=UPI000B83F52A|nr:ShET2/EspL2 family type III secretion system effector toxin [Candidatus Ichthyocystis sparus]